MHDLNFFKNEGFIAASEQSSLHSTTMSLKRMKVTRNYKQIIILS